MADLRVLHSYLSAVSSDLRLTVNKSARSAQCLMGRHVKDGGGIMIFHAQSDRHRFTIDFSSRHDNRDQTRKTR